MIQVVARAAAPPLGLRRAPFLCRIGVIVILGSGQVVETAGYSSERGFAALARRLSGRQSVNTAVLVTAGITPRFSLGPMGTQPGVRVDPAIPEQVSRIVQAGREIAVVDLLLNQAILQTAAILFELRNLTLQLVVFVLQMAQTRH